MSLFEVRDFDGELRLCHTQVGYVVFVRFEGDGVVVNGNTDRRFSSGQTVASGTYEAMQAALRLLQS